MATIVEDVAQLSENIGPRPAGTEEEQQAALYIADEFQKSAGFSTVIEDFNCLAHGKLVRTICFAVGFLMALLPLFLPVIAIPACILGIAAAVVYVLELRGKDILSRHFHSGVSQNVVAKYQPAGKQSNARSRKIVLVTNYDSAKIDKKFQMPIAPYLGKIRMAVLISLIAAPLILLIKTVFFLNATGGIVVFFNILIIICLILMALPLIDLALERTSGYAPAANNNATGVGVLLETARTIGNGMVSPEELEARAEEEGAVVHGQDAARESGVIPEGVEVEYEAQESNVSPEESLMAAKAAIAALTGQPVADKVPVTDISSKLVQVGEPANAKSAGVHFEVDETVGKTPVRVSRQTSPRALVEEREELEREAAERAQNQEAYSAQGNAQASASPSGQAVSASAPGAGQAGAQPVAQSSVEAPEPEKQSFTRETPQALRSGETGMPAKVDKTPAWAKSAQAKAHANKPELNTNTKVSRSRFADTVAAQMTEAQIEANNAFIAAEAQKEHDQAVAQEEVQEQKPMTELEARLAALHSEIAATPAPHFSEETKSAVSQMGGAQDQPVAVQQPVTSVASMQEPVVVQQQSAPAAMQQPAMVAQQSAPAVAPQQSATVAQEQPVAQQREPEPVAPVQSSAQPAQQPVQPVQPVQSAQPAQPAQPVQPAISASATAPQPAIASAPVQAQQVEPAQGTPKVATPAPVASAPKASASAPATSATPVARVEKQSKPAPAKSVAPVRSAKSVQSAPAQPVAKPVADPAQSAQEAQSVQPAPSNGASGVTSNVAPEKEPAKKATEKPVVVSVTKTEQKEHNNVSAPSTATALSSTARSGSAKSLGAVTKKEPVVSETAKATAEPFKPANNTVAKPAESAKNATAESAETKKASKPERITVEAEIDDVASEPVKATVQSSVAPKPARGTIEAKLPLASDEEKTTAGKTQAIAPIDVSKLFNKDEGEAQNKPVAKAPSSAPVAPVQEKSASQSNVSASAPASKSEPAQPAQTPGGFQPAQASTSQYAQGAQTQQAQSSQSVPQPAQPVKPAQSVQATPQAQPAQPAQAPVASPILGMESIPSISGPLDKTDNNSSSAQSERQVIVLPEVVSSVVTSGDAGKQRAPMAETNESTRSGAKALLSNMLPRIDESGNPSSSEAKSTDTFGLNLPPLGESAEVEHNTVSPTGSFSTVGGTGAFAPVGDELVADVAPEEIYIDDADDSAYEQEFTQTGAFAGPGYVDMPTSRAGRLFGKFRSKKKKKKNNKAESSMSEWIEADENYNAQSVGKARGSWDSFREDDGFDDSYADGEFVDDGYQGNDQNNPRGWNGGAFSLKRLRIGNAKKGNAEEPADDFFDEEYVDPAEGYADPTERVVEPVSADGVAGVVPLTGQPQGQGAIDDEFKKLREFRYPGLDTEIWFVALGAEHAGHSGMQALMAEHADELKGAIIINLEALGAGDLTFIEREGFFKPKVVTSRVKRFLNNATQKTGIRYSVASMDSRDTASQYAMTHGLQAFTLMGMENNQAALYGSPDDSIDNIDEEVLKENTSFIMGILKSI